MLSESATNVTELRFQGWWVDNLCIPLFKEFQENEDVWYISVFHIVHFF